LTCEKTELQLLDGVEKRRVKGKGGARGSEIRWDEGEIACLILLCCSLRTFNSKQDKSEQGAVKKYKKDRHAA
jgi:hypothetical protein